LKDVVEISSPELDPESPEAQILDEAVMKEASRPLPDQRVTMTMRNTDVNVILRALARSADQNIMMNEGVAGITNISVINTPWDQVFRAILATRGLTYTWEGDIIRVMTISDMKNEVEMDRVRKERVYERLQRRELAPLVTRIIPVKYADAHKLRENLWDLMEGGKQGSENQGADVPYATGPLARGGPRVLVDEHNNSLIVHAKKNEIDSLLEIVRHLDRPTAQIRIEANIVEATRETARELGIEWGGLYHGKSSKNFWITPGDNTGGVEGSSVDTALSPSIQGMAANFPADFVADGGKGLTFGYLSQKVGSYILDVRLSALQSEGKLNILSSPSITTMDNQTAFTESGEKVPYVTTDEEGDTEVKFENAVLRLEITPNVIDDKHLKMKIIVKKDEVDTSRTVEGNPFILKKQTETTLIVRDGETIVISGLTKQLNSDVEDGVPFLKDLPVLGGLFKGSNSSHKMEDVLVFITPYVLGPPGHEANTALSTGK
jgi:type IV pilus assembly protein PilQ